MEQIYPLTQMVFQISYYINTQMLLTKSYSSHTHSQTYTYTLTNIHIHTYTRIVLHYGVGKCATPFPEYTLYIIVYMHKDVTQRISSYTYTNIDDIHFFIVYKHINV